MESLKYGDDEVDKMPTGIDQAWPLIRLDLKDANHPRVTWQPCSGEMVIKITAAGQMLDMTIGRDAIRQLKQALDRADAA